MKNLIGWVVLASVVNSFVYVAAEARRPIEVRGALKSELNNVLRGTDELRKAFYDKDEPQIAARIKGLLKTIDRAQSRSKMAEEQRPHLLKMLGAAKNSLETTQMTNGEARQKPLKDAFAQLVQIAAVYKLDRYRIYFCPKDKSTWLQKGGRPKNPVHPEKYGSCGRIVR